MRNGASARDNHSVIPVDSIGKAYLLLEYAVQKGLPIDKQVMASLVEAKLTPDPSTWAPEIEISFWQAYDKLADITKPVNVRSLKAINNKAYESGLPFLRKFMKRPMVSEADHVIRYYRGWTVFSLIALLIVQINFSYGTGIVDQVNETHKSIVQTYEDEKKIQVIPEGKRTQAQSLEITALKEKSSHLEDKFHAGVRTLQKLIIFNNYLVRNIKDIDDNPRPEAVAQQKIQKDAVTIQNAILVLNVVQYYLLPLLYGFLGAFAFILRSLSFEIKNVTYTRDSNVLYLVRLILGGLSGLAIGWFIRPDKVSSLKEVSPFALAFVAGYGSELLFFVMDKIILAFSSGTPQKQPSHKQD